MDLRSWRIPLEVQQNRSIYVSELRAISVLVLDPRPPHG